MESFKGVFAIAAVIFVVLTVIDRVLFVFDLNFLPDIWYCFGYC